MAIGANQNRPSIFAIFEFLSFAAPLIRSESHPESLCWSIGRLQPPLESLPRDQSHLRHRLLRIAAVPWALNWKSCQMPCKILWPNNPSLCRQPHHDHTRRANAHVKDGTRRQMAIGFLRVAQFTKQRSLPKERGVCQFALCL